MEENGIERVIQKIDERLEILVKLLDPSLIDTVISKIFVLMIETFKQILLVGGKRRKFIPKHAQLFKQNLEQLKLIFVKSSPDSFGIDLESADREIRPLLDILKLFELDTLDLISKFDIKSRSPSNMLIGQILIHRKDRTAKIFWKKQKLYKRMKI